MDVVKKVFNKFDANGDGKIDASELRSVLHTLGIDATPTVIDTIMSEIDTDGDGFIDLKEFASSHLVSSGEDAKEIREAFDVYDHDKDGLITASELHMTMKRLGEECTLEDCEKMIKAVDVDGDGNVNFEEFIRLMNKN